MWSKIKPYVLGIALPLIVGAVAGWLTKDSFAEYMMLKQPPLSPPEWVFPVVWTILYILMGIGSTRVYLSHSPERRAALQLYGWQLAVNFIWPLLFFRWKLRMLALVCLVLLIVLIVLMIKRFAAVDKWAAYLQIPYLLWSLFALYLNASVWWLNR